MICNPEAVVTAFGASWAAAVVVATIEATPLRAAMATKTVRMLGRFVAMLSCSFLELSQP
jgi:hypothetical protein